MEVGIVGMRGDGARDGERVVIRVRHDREEPSGHGVGPPYSNRPSRPTVSPGREPTARIASSTPGMNDVRSVES